MKTPVSPALALLLLIGTHLVAQAEEFVEARITRIKNQVEVINVADPSAKPAQAKLDEILSGQNGLRTGRKSRAELTFNDDTIARVGANTLFSFKEGQREVLLGRGTLLFQCPKNKGGMKITSAAISASITGTTGIVQTNARSYSKFIIMEGQARVFLNNRLGESVLVGPGKMLIMPPNARSIPQPVDIDVQKLFETSGLVQDMGEDSAGEDEGGTGGTPDTGTSNTQNQDEGGTPTTGGGDTGLDVDNIESSINEQKQLIRNGVLAETPLSIRGDGTELVFEFDAAESVENDKTQTNTADTNTANPESTVNNDPKLPTNPVNISINDNAVWRLVPERATIGGGTFKGATYRSGNTDLLLTDWLFGSTSQFDRDVEFDDDPEDFDHESVVGFKFSDVSITNGLGDIVELGANEAMGIVSERNITITNFDDVNEIGGDIGFFAQNGYISAHNVMYDANNTSLILYARGPSGNLTLDGYSYLRHFNHFEAIAQGNMIIGDHTNSTTIVANYVESGNNASTADFYAGGTIKFDYAHIDAGTDGYPDRPGDIEIESRKTDLASNQISIEIGSSAQIRALADSLSSSRSGEVRVRAESGKIYVNGTVEAWSSNNGEGMIDIRNNGPSGVIEIGEYASLSANIMKIGALGSSGQVIIRNGLSANHTLKIYGGTGGRVLFDPVSASMTLGGSAASKVVRAGTVEVANGKTVVVNGGALQIYTNNAHWNNGANTTGGDGGGYGTITAPSSSASLAGNASQAPGF